MNIIETSRIDETQKELIAIKKISTRVMVPISFSRTVFLLFKI